MIKVPINIDLPNSKRTKFSKKANKEEWYIFKTKYLLAAAFYKSAGGVGRIILDYLLWKRSMNGNQWISLPNAHFKIHFGIERQRKSEALYKLEKDKLIDVERQFGKATLIKLSIRN